MYYFYPMKCLLLNLTPGEVDTGLSLMPCVRMNEARDCRFFGEPALRSKTVKQKIPALCQDLISDFR